jgi:hypothetical protein
MAYVRLEADGVTGLQLVIAIANPHFERTLRQVYVLGRSSGVGRYGAGAFVRWNRKLDDLASASRHVRRELQRQ